MTLFDLLHWCAIGAAVAVGATMGYHQFGIVGAVGGGAAGFVLGYILGRLPLAVMLLLLRRDLRRSSADRLRERINSQYFISHLIMAELASRDEDLEPIRAAVKAQLDSDEEDIRRFGRANAQHWFPDLIDQPDDDDDDAPNDDTDADAAVDPSDADVAQNNAEDAQADDDDAPRQTR